MHAPSHARHLHVLGVKLLLEKCGFSRSYHPAYVKGADGRLFMVHVQNMVGAKFTHDINGRDNFVENLTTKGIIFVNYERRGFIEVYECLDNTAYEVKEVAGQSFTGDRTFKRIAMVFDASKMKLLHTFDDYHLWERFRQHSSCRALNLESPHYAKS